MIGSLWHTQPLPLTVVQRAEWGALPPNLQACEEQGHFDPRHNPGGWLEYPQPLSEVLRTIVVHHSALTPEIDVAAIQRLHQTERGFADIAYHFVVAADGQVYEGRSLQVRGAHVQAANSGSVGVVLLGNFQQQWPTPAQLLALHSLVADLLRRAGGITHLAGHRQFNEETVCPGQHLMALLPELAHAHGLRFGTGGYCSPNWVRK